MTPKKQNAQMMEIMDFTQNDLVLNKKSKLSREQIENHYHIRGRLREDMMRRYTEKQLVVSGLVLWVILYAILVLTGIFHRIEDLLGVLTVPAFTVTAVLYMTFRQRQYLEAMSILRELSDPDQPIAPVSVAEGKITKIVEHETASKFVHQEYVLIAGRKIRVMPGSLDVLDEETTYRFYYLDHNGVDMFLSAEVVTGDLQNRS
jgi:hypothetical protein